MYSRNFSLVKDAFCSFGELGEETPTTFAKGECDAVIQPEGPGSWDRVGAPDQRGRNHKALDNPNSELPGFGCIVTGNPGTKMRDKIALVKCLVALVTPIPQ